MVAGWYVVAQGWLCLCVDWLVWPVGKGGGGHKATRQGFQGVRELGGSFRVGLDAWWMLMG